MALLNSLLDRIKDVFAQASNGATAIRVVNPDGTDIAGGSGGNGAILDGSDSNIKATVKDLTNSNPVTVAIVDGAGDQITSFGGGTQYTEGDTDASITGTALMFESNTGTNAVSVVSNSAPLPVSDAGGSLTIDNAGLTALNSSISSNTVSVRPSAGTPTLADDTTNAPSVLQSSSGNDMYLPVFPYMFDGTNWDRARGNSTDGLLVNLGANNDVSVTGTVAVTQSGTWDEVGINDSGNSITVDNGGTFAVQVDGAALTSLQLIDDAVYTDGTGTVTKGVAILGQDGTNPQAIKTDANGELQIDVLTMPTTTVQATDLDIRNLTSTDQVTVADIKDGAGDSVMDATNNAIKVNVVAGGAGDGAILDGVSSSIKATVLDYTNSNPLAVRLTDTNGDYIAAGAGTQYTEGDTDASITGSAILWEDTGDTLRAVSATKPLPVGDAGGSITVDNGGTFAVQAAQSGTWNITNVSGTISLPTGAATLAEQQTQTTALQLLDDVVATTASAITTKGLAVSGTDGTNARVLKTDTSGELQVDILSIAAGDNNIGNVDIVTVPSDPFGSNADAAATAGSTGSMQAKFRLMTSQLDSIKTAVETLDNTVAGSELQVDIVGSLPAGTNAIGKLSANSGVDIGDVDVTSLPALASGTNAIGKLLPPDIDVTSHTNYARKYYTNAGAVTDGIIWSPAAGKRWHVITMYIQVSAASTVTLEDDKVGGDDPVWKGELAANSGVVLQFTEKYPMASGEDAADLLVTTTAGNVYITCVGYEI